MNSDFYQLTKINTSRKIDLDDKYEDEIEDATFSDDNEDFINFKSDVKEWLTLDDDIITLQKAIKERKNRKNELTPKVLDFMARFKINDLNTHEGKLKFTKSFYTKPLNKQFLISKLSDFFKDFNKGEKAASFVLENRDKEEKFKLTRVNKRT